jgi:ATP-binding cassette subfamily B protein
VIALARPHPQASYLVPEVVQTSVMDCGPASLQALVEGFGLSVSYGRLREACQTGVDGTSISTMDEIAQFLGLDTEEMMVPFDHLLVADAHALPAIVVVKNPSGANHFVVVWSIAGPWIQVMDPAEGRHWMLRSVLFDRLYLHHANVPASAWRSWVGEPEFLATLGTRLAALDIAREARDRLCVAALANPGWQAMAALDAATRMTTAMVQSGAVSRGAACLSLIERQVERSDDGRYPLILGEYRSTWRAPEQDGDEETLIVRGAVLVRARGRHAADRVIPAPEDDGGSTETAGLPPELAAALHEEQARPGRMLLGMLLADGIATPAVLAMVLVVSAALITVDAILLRGFLEVGTQLGLASQRAAAMAGLVGFLALGLFVELPLVASALRLGRTLDLRLRMAFLAKIPRLDDRYFRSRLLSDMAERGHSLHLVRSVPQLGVRMLSASAQLLLTVVGLAWLQPASVPLAMVAVVVGIGLPLACQPLLAERDLRVRGHAGALGRFYLDALLGLLPIRVHGARPAMQRRQEAFLVQWIHAGLRYYAASTLVEGALALCGLGVAVLLVRSVASQTSSGLLLLVYWALSLPALGQEIAILTRQYPVMRNVVARLLEPLGTPEAQADPSTGASPDLPPGPDERRDDRGDDRSGAVQAAAIRMSGVSVEAAGNTVLADIDLVLAPGEHVAIVGPSGAGKSSLVGLLLGWYRPARGTVEVDGRPLVGDWLSTLRRDTAWVDPSVALWNRSFLDNLRYGASHDGELPLAEILSKARLREVLEHLPDGLATELGEGGGMVSGGEGQRTRVGRALARKRARLVILDEPFRGLDLATRRALLAMVRQWWRDATVLWVTHDIAETESFGRVLVIDGGRIVEDGDPAELGNRPGARYAALVRSDRDMHATEWSAAKWRRVWLADGKLREDGRDS